jgi:soluble lytic murein transglycosylase-like protein
LSAPSSLAARQVYTFVDQHGVRHISNVPDDPRYQEVTERKRQLLGKSNRHRYAPYIHRVAHKVRLDPNLIKAVIQAESNFDPYAVSRAGAVGLMQLMPQTAARYGVKDRQDPIENLRGGAEYLRDLIDEFKNLRLALAAYNAGEGAVRRYGNQIPPYEETQTYVERVERFYRQFRGT